MPPRQTTFALVPKPVGLRGPAQSPSPLSPSKPPMTSKQVQKLYRQRNRQPRMSKAEQRRLELAEQERIRKEIEKEKQAARARAARERKKFKEQQAREEKKRNGLPLVSVRPSQDTIARFIRVNGVGQKREADGIEVRLPKLEEMEDGEDDEEGTSPKSKVSGTSTCEESRETCTLSCKPRDKQTDSRVPKRRKLNNASSQQDDEEAASVATGTITPAPPLLHKNSDRSSKQGSFHADDPAMEEMFQTQSFVETVVAARTPVTTAPTMKPPRPIEQPTKFDLAVPKPKTEAQVKTNHSSSVKTKPDPHQRLRQSLHETPENAARFVRSNRLDFDMRTRSSPYMSATRPLSTASPRSMAQPPMPPPFMQPPQVCFRSTERPSFLPKHLHTPIQQSVQPHHVRNQQENEPPGLRIPMSTQMLLSRLGEFLPTSSQEARELLEDDSPSATVLSKPATFSKHPRVTKSEPRRPPVRPSACASSTFSANRREGPQQLALPPVPFFSSQDFVLSTQDIRELEDGTVTPSKLKKTTASETIRIPLIEERSGLEPGRSHPAPLTTKPRHQPQDQRRAGMSHPPHRANPQRSSLAPRPSLHGITALSRPLSGPRNETPGKPTPSTQAASDDALLNPTAPVALRRSSRVSTRLSQKSQECTSSTTFGHNNPLRVPSQPKIALPCKVPLVATMLASTAEPTALSSPSRPAKRAGPCRTVPRAADTADPTPRGAAVRSSPRMAPEPTSASNFSAIRTNNCPSPDEKLQSRETPQPREPKRFFTADGGVPMTQLAIARSRRTFAEEERRRAEESESEGEKKQGKCGRGLEDESYLGREELESMVDFEVLDGIEEILHAADGMTGIPDEVYVEAASGRKTAVPGESDTGARVGIGFAIQSQVGRQPLQRISCNAGRKSSCSGKPRRYSQARRKPQSSKETDGGAAASQETDYGDPGWCDGLELLEDLGRYLEQDDLWVDDLE